MFSRFASGGVRTRKSAGRRKGIIVVLTAFLLIVLMAMLAFSIDVGYMSVTRTQIQTCADATALAGAGELPNGTSAAQTEALAFLGQNKVGNTTLSASNATLEFGSWDTTSKTFTVSNNSPNGIRVTLTSNNQPFFFGNVLGKSTFTAQAKSIAVFQPRDIGMVLDYSGSMCYDSQFRNIYLLGQSDIEANLLQIYQQLGSPHFGSLTFAPVAYGTTSTSNSTVKSHFGLTSVAYPYPDGSWDEYIDYVQTDSSVNSAGYRCKYGYLTWMNYTLAVNWTHAQTPLLYTTSEQPVTALKDAVDVFLAYLTEHETDDRVSLSIYTYSDGTAKLEQSLTKTYSLISNVTRNRQAAHYISGTNISAGMTKARLDLVANARTGAAKMMVLMTDGVVNLPTGNTSSDKQAVRDEAYLCAAAKIPVITVSLGALADTDLMQEVADITGGAAFVVPGGQPIADVQTQLEAVFGQVASDRPLQIVQ